MCQEETKAGSGLSAGLCGAEACVWAEDSDGNWSACDAPEGGRNAFYFEDEGPDENGFNFCPYCGRKLAAVYFDMTADA